MSTNVTASVAGFHPFHRLDGLGKLGSTPRAYDICVELLTSFDTEYLDSPRHALGVTPSQVPRSPAWYRMMRASTISSAHSRALEPAAVKECVACPVFPFPVILFLFSDCSMSRQERFHLGDESEVSSRSSHVIFISDKGTGLH